MSVVVIADLLVNLQVGHRLLVRLLRCVDFESRRGLTELAGVNVSALDEWRTIEVVLCITEPVHLTHCTFKLLLVNLCKSSKLVFHRETKRSRSIKVSYTGEV